MKIKEKVKQIWKDYGLVISTSTIVGGSVFLSYEFGKAVGINRYDKALVNAIEENRRSFSYKQEFDCPVNQLGALGEAISKQIGNLDENDVVKGFVGIKKK